MQKHRVALARVVQVCTAAKEICTAAKDKSMLAASDDRQVKVHG